MGAKEKSNWFYDKLNEDQRIQYCEEHPKSRICKLFFSGRGGVEKPSGKKVDPKLRIVKDDDNTDTVNQVAGQEEKKDHDYYAVDTEYEWAKKNTIQNLGEDIKGSARHSRNQHRDWGTLQDMASNKEFNKKELLKHFEPDPESVPTNKAPAYYVIRDILRAYPEKGTAVNGEDWINLYKEFWEKGKSIAESEENPIVVGALFKEYIKSRLSCYAYYSDEGRYFGEFSNYAQYGAFQNKNGTMFKMLKPFLSELSVWDINRIMRNPNSDLATNAFSRLTEEDFQKKMKLVYEGQSFTKAFNVSSDKQKEPSFSPVDLYKAVVKVRDGGREFNSADECAKFFMEEMGARGVQFGNSLTTQERFFHMKTTAESFVDLATALDVPVNKLNLDGRFAIGFASRGTKGSLATYHPHHEILNMNRDAEYGALAHEFGHAIGFRLGDICKEKRGANNKKKYCISEIGFSSLNTKGTVSESFASDLVSVNNKILKRIGKSEEFKSLSTKSSRKWALEQAEGFARGWEKYVERKLSKKGMKNTYLVGGFSDFRWPTEEELDELEPLFDKLVDEYFRK